MPASGTLRPEFIPQLAGLLWAEFSESYSSCLQLRSRGDLEGYLLAGCQQCNVLLHVMKLMDCNSITH